MNSNAKLNISEYVVLTQLKRKLREYCESNGYKSFLMGTFPQGLTLSLMNVLEELIVDSIVHATKDKSGLYTINMLVLKTVINDGDKYDFALKYMKKYNNNIRYADSIFFNFTKMANGLETKHGSKLMIDMEARNLMAYMILNLQYDITNLCLLMTQNSNRKTLTLKIIESVCGYLLSNDLASKIKLKLDSYNISENEGSDGEEDGTDGDVVSNDVDDNTNTVTSTEVSTSTSTSTSTNVDENKQSVDTVNVQEPVIVVRKKANKKAKNIEKLADDGTIVNDLSTTSA